MKYVLEVEGFCLKRRFIFKEITLIQLDNGESYHFLVKPPCRFDDLSAKDKSVIRFGEKHQHGIHFHAGKVYLRTVKEFLQDVLKEDTTVYTRGLAKLNYVQKQLGLKTPSFFNVNELEPTASFWSTAIEKYLEVHINEDICPLRFHRQNRWCSNLKALVLKDYLTRNQP